MLLVKTRLGQSRIQGIGLFADQDIKKGDPVWKFTNGFDLSKTEEELNQLSESAKEQYRQYDYFNPRSKKHVLCFDNARFVNHSAAPNLVSTHSYDDEKDIVIAARKIVKGEELTMDYRKYDGSYIEKMQK